MQPWSVITVRLYLLTLSIFFIFSLTHAQFRDYTSYPVYNGCDLGLTLTGDTAEFRIWSPPAEKVKIIFYEDGTGGTPVHENYMDKSVDGTWLFKTVLSKLQKFYVFSVFINGEWSKEVPDPYAKFVGVNGRRAMIGNLRLTDPEGWTNDRSPGWMINKNEESIPATAKKNCSSNLRIACKGCEYTYFVGHKPQRKIYWSHRSWYKKFGGT